MRSILRFTPLIAALTVYASFAFAGSPQGLANFHKVDDHVYRGAQPDDDGFSTLAGMGVKTVIDLRGNEHSEAREKQLVEAAGMRYVSIPMWGMRTPTDNQISSALKLMNDPSAGPVFVHCKRGADRTGGVVACYRIEHDHWSSSNALREARGFGMSWYQLAIQHYVVGFGHCSTNMPIPATLAP
jgi:protein tyrosine/serine phosphatase